MTRIEKIKAQLEVLYELSPRFGGKTFDNVVVNLEKTLKELENEQK